MKPSCQNQTRLQEIGRDQRFIAKCQAHCNSYFHKLKRTGQWLKKFMCTIKLLFVFRSQWSDMFTSSGFREMYVARELLDITWKLLLEN